jgi:hypothetical protein
MKSRLVLKAALVFYFFRFKDKLGLSSKKPTPARHCETCEAGRGNLIVEIASSAFSLLAMT